MTLHIQLSVLGDEVPAIGDNRMSELAFAEPSVLIRYPCSKHIHNIGRAEIYWADADYAV